MGRPLSIVLILILAGIGGANARETRPYDSFTALGRHEIRASFGILTTDQVAGITTASKTKFDFPSAISGADFITYRYYLLPWFAVGLCAGIDYQSGKLTSYSRTSPKNFGGTYDRCAYTIASDYTFIFMDKKYFQMYSGFGVGYTYYRANKTYDKTFYNSQYHNGVNYIKEQQSSSTEEKHINLQVTGLGIKSNGLVSVFLEVGFGYKGLASAGLAIRFK